MKTIIDNRTGISISGTNDDMDIFTAILQKSYSDEAAYISILREQGFKAAHPNDGWANKKPNIIYLRYPIFNDGLNIGDKLMIGNYYNKVKKAVIITEILLNNIDSVYNEYKYIPIVNENKRNKKLTSSLFFRIFGL